MKKKLYRNIYGVIMKAIIARISILASKREISIGDMKQTAFWVKLKLTNNEKIGMTTETNTTRQKKYDCTLSRNDMICDCSDAPATGQDYTVKVAMRMCTSK